MANTLTLHYSKYKTSDGLFFKRIEHASITFNRGSLDISIMPYITYGGHYSLDSIAKQEHSRVIFNSTKNGLPFFVSVSNDQRKIMIFDNNMVGIILKK